MDVPPQEASSKGKEATKTKRKRKSPLVPWKKPKGMPKRPLSAYNLFFQDRRQSIMEEAFIRNRETEEGDNNSTRRASKKKSGVGFAKLAKKIGSEWKGLDAETKAPYEKQAATDKQRYDGEMKVWRAKEQAEKAARDQRGPFLGDAYMDYSIGIPPVAGYSAVARKGGRDIHADMLSRMGSRSLSDIKQQYELKGLFDASIHASSSIYADATNTSPFQLQKKAMQQKMQNPNDCSLSTLSIENKRQLSAFTDSILQNQSQPDLSVQECQRMNSARMDSGVQQMAHSYQCQNQSRWFPGSNTHGDPHFSGSDAETMRKTDAPPGFSNNETRLSEWFDLEPVPLPEDKPIQNQQYEQVDQRAFAGSQNFWLNQQHLTRQAIVDTEESIRRLSGGPVHTWFERNTNIPMASDRMGHNASTGFSRTPLPTSDSHPLDTGRTLPREIKGNINFSHTFSSSHDSSRNLSKDNDDDDPS